MMPEEPFVPDEALEFHGIGIPLTQEESEQAQLEMAHCFIEEYIRMGYTPQAIVELCQDPFYRGLHAIWQNQGEPFVRTLIGAIARQWRPSVCAGDAGGKEESHATGL